MDFFTDDFRNDGYDSSLKSAFQGQLASSYTNALTDALSTDEAASWIGFLANTVNGLSLEQAIAVRDAVAAGDFTLDGLFSAAQSKAGPVDGLAIADPEPTLTVIIDGEPVVIDLTAILGGLDTETWTQTDTSGGGKKGAITVTTYHTREFYTSAGEPADFDPDWWEEETVNLAPEANPIVVDDVLETQSEYDDDHEITNTDPDTYTVQLIDGVATDPEGQPLSIVADSVTLDGGDPLPDYITVVGDTVVIDQNHRDLDELLDGEQRVINLTYQITDGENVISNTVAITITGTADQYEGHGEDSVSNTHYRSDSTTGGGNINDNTLVVELPDTLPDDAFDFSYTGSLDFTSSGLEPRTGTPGNFDQADTAGASDATPADWVGGAVNLTDTHQSELDVALAPGALDDLTVNYNVNITSDDDSDSITVTLNYEYDYWYWA